MRSVGCVCTSSEREKSKLSPFRDGWRHLRLMLVYSPNFLFTLPGALMALFGALIIGLVFGRAALFGHTLFFHAEIGGSLLVVLGAQLVGFGLCGRAFGVFQLGDRDPWLERMQTRFKLEHGLLFGVGLALAGLSMGGVVVGKWVARGFGTLSEQRLAVLAATLVIVGAQVFFTSFLISIIGLPRRED